MAAPVVLETGDASFPSRVHLPRQLAIRTSIVGNTISQIHQAERASERMEAHPYPLGNLSTYVLREKDQPEVLLIDRPTAVDGFRGNVLQLPAEALADLATALGPEGNGKWIVPAPYSEEVPEELSRRAEQARGSWRNAFTFRVEDRATEQEGLRPPQAGALHAVLAHWSVSADLATVVMPTGTGKTETMLALLAHERCEKLLVLVPTSPLREQTCEKFLTFGLLQKLGVLSRDILLPVVGKMEHRLSSVEEVDQLFASCNVVISTVAAVAGCHKEVIERIAVRTTHLFIDEAHHVAAETWSEVRRCFVGTPILQFTATPFRRDGRRVDGKILYSYPLRKAQEEEYFKPIRLVEVWEFDEELADQAIATAALAQLDADLACGKDHLVMARVNTIARAEALLTLYRELGPHHLPITVHSKQKVREQREAFTRLRQRDSRVVVCVDMLGEGFDFPELKIAALHDVHQSLTITLQFTGRFTRSKGPRIGNATMVVNLADPPAATALRELYAENADWDQIIERLGHNAVAREERRSDFLTSFSQLPEDVPVQNITPKMSTVAYRVQCQNWTPDGIYDVVKEEVLFRPPAVSEEHKVALFVTRETQEVEWGDIHGLEDIVWHLYLLHWDEQRQLLFIHSSNNGTFHEELATAIGGSDATRIKGEQAYRVLDGIQRLILTNVGLKHALGRAVRHTMHTGADVGEYFTAAHLETKTKTNLFGRGYEAGDRATIGISTRGRLWSFKKAADLSSWVDWCHYVGDKLLNDRINVDHILRGAIIPVPVTERPSLAPLAIEWPEEFYNRDEELVSVAFGERIVPFYEVGLELVNHERTGPLRFRVFTANEAREYQVQFSEGGPSYTPTGWDEAEILVGKRRRPLSEWFRSETPRILFEQDTLIEDDHLHVYRPGDKQPYPREKIQAWDWTGVDIRKESQRDEKRPDSIQRRVIDLLLQDGDWEIVFDDDEANEAADVVALRVQGETLLIHFYHCKFATKSTAGARIKELYEVCGQAQKSVRWRERVSHLLDHLMAREKSRLRQKRPSRFEQGSPRKLVEIKNRSHLLIPDMSVFVVQPGASKAEISTEQLELLSATELYLQVTFGIRLTVVTSA